MIYIEIGIITLLGLLFEHSSNDRLSLPRKRAIYIVVCIALLWLMAALRNIYWVYSLHLDALNYSYMLSYNRTRSFADIFSSFIQRYVYRVGDTDIGYYLLNKIVGIFVEDYNIFSLIIDAIFFVPFGLLLYKYTTRIRQLIFAFIFYIALIQIHMLSGARQMFAIGLDIAAVMLAIDKKRAKAIILLLLGATLHLSSIIMIAPILLIFFDIKSTYLKRIHAICLLLFPVILVFPNHFIVILAKIIGSEKYGAYGTGAIQGGATTFIILIEMLSVFCFFALDLQLLESNPIVKKLYAMVPFITVFGPLIHSSGSMIRICMYFYIYLVLLIPYGFDRLFSKNSQKLAYVILIVSLIYLIVRGGTMDYHFMWQPI